MHYDFCISQGNVAKILRWGGQNCSRLRRIPSWCCMPKIIKVGQCFVELFENNTGTVFFWDRVHTYVQESVILF